MGKTGDQHGVVVDIDTTGLFVKSDILVEVGAAKSKRIIKTFLGPSKRYNWIEDIL